MTQRPEWLTERPATPAVGELLRAVRLTGAVYYRIDAAVPWPTIAVAAGPALAGAFGGRTRTVISYHVVVEGELWVGLAGGAPTRLTPGDVVVFPRGDLYYLMSTPSATLPGADPEPLRSLLRGVAAGAVAPTFHAPQAAAPAREEVRLLCGFLGCDPRAFDRLLSALPPMFVLSAREGRLDRLVAEALSEVEGPAVASPVRERLSELLFIETVRRYAEERDLDVPTLAAEDRVVGHALTLLHGEPSRPWTLPSLASASGTSRSVLADRFARQVGQPPMQYLAGWRIQLAVRRLAESDDTVAAVAAAVGYGSEAAFSRAFKRALGVSPGAWRSSLVRAEEPGGTRASGA